MDAPPSVVHATISSATITAPAPARRSAWTAGQDRIVSEPSVGRAAIISMATATNQTLVSVDQAGLGRVAMSVSSIRVARMATVLALGSVSANKIGAVCCVIKISTIVAHTSPVRTTAPARTLHQGDTNATVWTASRVSIAI